ncbi:MAG: helix-turn-helix domain-containing protein [Bacteroidetes bacterium]|nr:MAG: helix-turn-helix domain-containing protein [Bacteroidota bacterium]
MDQNQDIQLQIFRRIRDQLPGHVSLVDEVADILGVSNDSAYRRIRGEKALSIQEVSKLAETFRISLDDLTAGHSDTVTFRANFLRPGSYTFRE